MIMLDYVVQILDMQDLDQPEPTVQDQQAVLVLQPRQIGPALVDDNPIRHAIGANRSLEKSPSGCFVATLGEHEIKGFTEFDDSAAIVRPLAFDLDLNDYRLTPVGSLFECNSRY
jgi:hypothetical protein